MLRTLGIMTSWPRHVAGVRSVGALLVIRRPFLSAGRTFESLKVRNFRLFFTGQFISQAGTWLTTVALTLLVLHRTNSGTAVGVLVACQFLPVLLLGAWGGVIADRSDKRRL